MLLTPYWLADIFLLLATSTFLLYKYLTRNFSHWQKKGVFFPKPIPLFGNLFDVMTFKLSIGHWLQHLYNSTDERFLGVFCLDQPFLIVRCPELVKQILVKDFRYFKDRVMHAPDHSKFLPNMLFFQKSPGWKTARTKMNPFFAIGKLKGVFPLIGSVGEEMRCYIEKNSGPVDAKEICAKYSTEIIAKCAFGIDGHSFDEGIADFRKIGQLMMNGGLRNGIIQSAHFFLHGLVDMFKLQIFPMACFEYFNDAIWTAIRTREETKGFRNDLIDILIEMRKDKDLCRDLNFEGEVVAAQPVMFFVAGFETSSTVLSFTLYELCIHTDIQDRLRQEIDDSITKHRGITYEAVEEMDYLELCLKESLRKYPALPFLDRRCNDDYKIPGTDVVIEKGTPVLIPALGLHYDEKFFPEPEEYIPDRFSDKSAYNVDGYNYLPFGEGPRYCIGKIFGIWSVKLALVHIVKNFEIIRVPSTPVPMIYEAKSITLRPIDGLPMIFKKIKQ